VCAKNPRSSAGRRALATPVFLPTQARRCVEARVKRYRDDKRAEDADTMEGVRRIFRAPSGSA
jgi:hypothetical protein